MAHLCVPYQLVGIHRCIIESAPTVHIEVRRQLRTPGCRQLDASSVGESPRTQVVILLQLTTCISIVQCAVEFYLQPVVAVAGGDTLTQRECTGLRLLRIGILVDTHKAHAVHVVHRREGVDIVIGGRVDGSIEHQHTEGTPVAVDILWSCDISTRLLIIRHLITNRVAGGLEVQVCHHATLVLLVVIIVEETDILCEGRFQSWVTLTDIQRVRIIGDIQQVAHAGLCRRTAVGEAQLSHVRELPTDIGGWREVGDGTCHIAVYALIVLDEM